MAIAETINSIKQNVTNAYTKLEEKGATIPDNKNIENLASTIDSVSAGGGGDTLAELLNGTLTSYNGSATGIRQYAFTGYTNLISFKNSEVMNTTNAYGAFDGCKNIEEMDITINGASASLNYMFRDVASNKSGDNINIKIQDNGDMSYTFQRAKVNKVIFENLTYFNGYTFANAFNTATINELYCNKVTGGTVAFQNTANSFYNAVIERLYFEKLTKIPENFFGYGYGSGLKKIFLGTQCILANSGYKTVPTESKIFVPYDAYFGYYNTATNWTTFFNSTIGNTDSRMFAYKDCTQGDELPSTYVDYVAVGYGYYSIEWFEDPDCTIAVSGTAPNTTRYYARFTLDRYEDEIL